MPYRIWPRLLPVVLLLVVAAMGANDTVFQDPLDGESRPGWKVAPSTFVEHPQYGTLLRYAHGTEPFGDDMPWVGDTGWTAYRVEVEILPEEGWSGVDVHVSNDGASGFDINFYRPDEKGQIVVEASGLWGESLAFKLWPLAQRTWRLAPGEWMPMRIDVGKTVANVHLDGATAPAATFHDLPFTSGGVRLMAYAGSGFFRNLRITRLEEEAVRPILDDPWAELKADGVIRQ